MAVYRPCAEATVADPQRATSGRAGSDELADDCRADRPLPALSTLTASTISPAQPHAIPHRRRPRGAPTSIMPGSRPRQTAVRPSPPAADRHLPAPTRTPNAHVRTPATGPLSSTPPSWSSDPPATALDDAPLASAGPHPDARRPRVALDEWAGDWRPAVPASGRPGAGPLASARRPNGARPAGRQSLPAPVLPAAWSASAASRPG